MTIEQYIEKVNTRFKSGISTEHSYRGDLQNLLEALCPDVLVTNEPSRVACGAPDYILTNKNIPIGYIEAKDIGASLIDKAYKEQFDRYKASLNNLIFTDYLDFHVYRDGQIVTTVAIGKIENGKLIADPARYKEFENIIRDFATHQSQTIRSAEKLSRMMAGKARMLATVIENAVTSDETKENTEAHEDANNSLKEQLAAFKEILIHDITPKDFADIYAQTIAYGMFAARLHDPSLETFTRIEAADLIPKTNPFLRKLFQYVAGYDLDNRIKWIVDALADIFRATDVAALLENFGKSTQQQDPIIHFYETFLSEYDPKLRKARGVWYTPEPVVSFIVRAVDDILKTEFGLKDGLADTSKTKVKVKVASKATADTRSKTKETEIEQEVHKVQILDPATGTGTFLAEIIKHIHKKFQGQQGIWSKYVDDHLIPRLNGFEILMASYAMAHLKLDLLLTETGYKAQKEQRFRVYLTNSLEEYHPDTGTLFANWLSSEANEANKVKRDTPVMVVLGNPPYSGESKNKDKWLMSLMEDYKKEFDGGKLKEYNIKFVNDDYVKFIRYSQWFIEKNGEGVLAFITNHNFISNPTFRGMRWSLINTFNEILIVDLHGNSMKNETAPDGTKDENVFDIRPGVSIIIAVRNKDIKGKLAKVKLFDMYGKRSSKYEFLNSNSLSSIKFEEINLSNPNFTFKNVDESDKEAFETGFKITDLFKTYSLGILTKNDSVSVAFNTNELKSVLGDFSNLDKTTLKEKYSIKEDSRDWQLQKAIDDVRKSNITQGLTKINYRPFDQRWTFISWASKGFIAYPQKTVSIPLSKDNNIGLIATRQLASLPFYHVFISNIISEQCFLSGKSREGGTVLPLFIYPESTNQQTLDGNQQRQPNLNIEIVDKIAAAVGLTFTAEKETTKGTFAPIDVLDYIYAVLHSPLYREKYKEFLKIDFPRVPYPKDKQTFWQLVKLGGELRQIHLLESPLVEKFITQFPVTGNNKVGKISFAIIDYDELPPAGAAYTAVYINEQQYFANVPEEAWNFYIGGYQPAQKWLKDRKGRELTFEDIMHYQKIIVALTETARLMKEIDKIEIE